MVTVFEEPFRGTAISLWLSRWLKAIKRVAEVADHSDQMCLVIDNDVLTL